jgi:hypothetical protein
MFGGGNPADKLSIRKKGVAEGSQPNDIAVYHHTGPNADKKAQAHAMKLGSDYGHFRHDRADKNDNLHIVTQKRYFPAYAKQQGVAEGKADKISQLKKDHDTAVHWSKNETSPQKREAARQKAEKIKRHLDTQYKQGVAEGQEEKCPHCGGAMFSEMIMNEKKDACYYKVKSRYKVWPSAYASGALVKCRKSGADSWGDGGKKNESSILEGIEQVDENLNKWFKEKWVRFGPDGKIRGDCARGDDSEGKPKCLPQSKAQNLGKEGRASAAARKRREDPNPERSGKAINVNTKKK